MRVQHVALQQLRRLFRRYPFLQRVSVATFLLTIIWLYVMYWGERSVYEDHIDDCHWEDWEKWPKGATPHHLVFIADPQLVDPHTYPGRPWPLSTLTERYTDLYMARNFRLMNYIIDPDTIIFLGDLFDGGREWAPVKPKKLKYSQRKRLEELGIRVSDKEGFKALQKRSVATYKAALGRPHAHEIDPAEHNIGKNGQDLKEFVPGENGRWSRWDNRQWQKDFRRFSRIFFEPDQLYPYQDRELFAIHNVSSDSTSLENGASTTAWQEYATVGGRQRRIMTSLPGNHDLGFGPGVQLPIRDRFQSHFGESNRLDVIGNHTIVSLDVLSLAAHSYFQSSGWETDTEQEDYKHLWLPGMQFMEQLRVPARKAVGEALRVYYPTDSEAPRWQHEVKDTELILQPTTEEMAEESNKPKPNLPVILLSHVPLFRPAETFCGSEREGSRPIQIRMGYQYQNVLTQGLSKDIVTKLGETAGEVVQIFSGDDHDYCNVIHRYNVAPDLSNIISTTMTHIREITVKTFSWAMGVRVPGFLLVSLWNPVDSDGVSLVNMGDEVDSGTIQTHLCLLPNQLNIFLDYGLLFLFTLAILIMDALYWSPSVVPSLGSEDNPLSPLSETRMSLPRFQLGMNGFTSKATPKHRQRGTSTSSVSHSRNNSAYLGVQRSYNARTRSVSPDTGGALIEKAGYYPQANIDDDSDEESHLSIEQLDWKEDSQAKWKWRRRVRTRIPEKWRRALEDLGYKLMLVAVPSTLYYLYLVRNG